MVEILHYLNRFQKVTLDKWERQAMSDFEGRDYTYAEVASQIVKMNLAFGDAGLEKGDKVAICGKNSAHWGMAFLSIAVYDAVAVPILYDFTPEAILDLCNHSDSSLLFTDIRTFTKLDMSKAKYLKAVVNIDDYSCMWAREESVRTALNNAEAHFNKEYPAGLRKEDVHFGKDFLDSIEVINYTSGTTGSPKGIMLTGRNLSTNIQFAIETIKVTYDDNSISMLPLAHMYGMTFEYLYTLCGGSHIYFVSRTPSPSLLMAVFAQVMPYILITVPLVMEKIIKGKVIPTLEKPAVKVITKIPLVNKLFYKMVGRKVLAALGGKVREIPIGGAPLNRQVEETMRKIGLPYAVGYGMTECAPLVAYVPYNMAALGSCGRAMAKYGEVRIDSYVPDKVPGEIQVRGTNVMAGYYKNPEANAAAFTEDGWLRTGDLGVMDKDGNIFIKGRSKCMILSSNGQNIYPEEIEHLVNNLPCINESVVVGRNHILAAIVSLNQDAVKGLPEGQTIDSVMKRNLETINKALPAYSQISKFEILEGGFVHTPKQSIKRTLYN
ncbi:MAG: AMP-binding protein [Bacteroidales bacterium]|nr:AMP-binding protein [Bacteroidales bacterium]